MTDTTRSELTEKLRALNIATVSIEYDGCDDQGCIEALTPYDKNGTPVTLPQEQIEITFTESVYLPETGTLETRAVTKTLTLEAALTEWCYDVLDRHCPGWPNNDGAFGSITIDVTSGTAELENNTRFTSYDTETVEL